jgi:hypothetical protein
MGFEEVFDLRCFVFAANSAADGLGDILENLFEAHINSPFFLKSKGD